MTDLEKELGKAELRIAEGERRITRQMMLIEELRADGHDVTHAETALEALQHTLEAWNSQRDAVLAVIRRLEQEELPPTTKANAPRCLARTRSGRECQSPAVKGKRRCRMHGGTNPCAPKGNRNAWKHGGRSAEAIATARYLKMIGKILDA
jgi:hypothetical protein